MVTGGEQSPHLNFHISCYEKGPYTEGAEAKEKKKGERRKESTHGEPGFLQETR
jgi:hypothetical protein